MKGLKRLDARQKQLDKWFPPHPVKPKPKKEKVDIFVPEWAKPLRSPARYKGAYGGRSGGKSHHFAEAIIERMAENPDLKVVCIREFQKSLRFSVKALLEDKIQKLKVSHLFQVLTTEIRRVDGAGIIIFQGMQDHTADSIKSLEGFDVAWVEEAQNLSARSLQLLRPTIRKAGSEIWFTWNPDQPTDPVDEFFRGKSGQPKDSILVSVNYSDNPLISEVSLAEMALDRDRDTDYYTHVWLGGYNIKSDLQILGGKWRVDEFVPDPETWDGPYYGADWGFSTDPTCAVKLWIYNNCLWVEYESWALNLDLDAIAMRWMKDIPGIGDAIVRADSSRPDLINHVKSSVNPVTGDSRDCIPKLIKAEKGPGSIESGILYLQSFTAIVVHERCKKYQEECRLYQYKPNAAGEPTPVIVDKHNHLIDSSRYALEPLIRSVSAKPDFAASVRTPAPNSIRNPNRSVFRR